MDKTDDTQSSPVIADPISDHDTNPRPDDRGGIPGPTASQPMAIYYWRRPGHPAPIGDIKPRRPLMITDI